MQACTGSTRVLGRPVLASRVLARHVLVPLLGYCTVKTCTGFTTVLCRPVVVPLGYLAPRILGRPV